MSRVLFAWELGSNYGHLSRLLPIAKRLRAQGYDVFFVVRDTAVAAQLLSQQGFAFTQTPLDVIGNRQALPIASYAEILLAAGYTDRATLLGMVQGWLNLIQLFRADIIIADHSPTALFAAHLTGLPAIPIGSGFEIPPDRSPMPSIRPWEVIPDDRLLRAEECVLDRMNTVASSCGGHSPNCISELFQGTCKILATFPELDHYGVRASETYVGPIFSSTGGELVTWSHSARPRVFAYLRPSVPGFEALLKALSKLQAEVIIVAPGTQYTPYESVTSPVFRVFGQPVQMDRLLESADLVVSYGGSIVNQCLLAGIPLLLTPQNVEQYLISQRVEALGAGVIATQSQDEAYFTTLLGHILIESAYRQSAASFAKRYADFKCEQVIDKVVELIEAALSGCTSR